jgi:hypothetical protein
LANLGETIWKLPAPSTALLGPRPVFEKRQERLVVISFSYESHEGEQASVLLFEGVEAFKFAYLSAAEPLEAYDRVMDRGETDWIASTRGGIPAGRKGRGDSAPDDFFFTSWSRVNAFR